MERIKLCLPTLIIILLISGFCVWYFQDQDYYDNWRRTKEAVILKQKDSLRKEIDSLQVLIDLRAQEIDSLKRIYPELENKLIMIKSQKDEKIRAVDSFSPAEFEEFFSNRYPKK